MELLCSKVQILNGIVNVRQGRFDSGKASALKMKNMIYKYMRIILKAGLLAVVFRFMDWMKQLISFLC